MGMNAFAVFGGYGLGPLAFEPLLKHGFSKALAVFAIAQLLLAMVAIPLLRDEDFSGEAASYDSLGRSPRNRR